MTSPFFDRFIQRQNLVRYGGFLLLGVGALLFRLPNLLNPDRMSSDHAFLGLQAMRLMHGDVSIFLWGSQYQVSWEPLVAAIYFALFGVSYHVLQWVPLSAFFLCLFIVYRILTAEAGVRTAFCLSLLYVITTQPVIAVNVHPYRQWCLFFCLYSVYLAYFGKQKNDWRWRAIGFLPFFALLVDFFAIQFLVPLAFYLTVRARDEKSRRALGQGAVVGLVLLGVSRLAATDGAPLAFAPKTFLHNVPLFFQICLPMLSGLTFSSVTQAIEYASAADYLRYLAGLGLILLQLVGGYLALRNSSIKRSTRLLAAFGTMTTLNCLAGFCGSSMAVDAAAVRYLQPLIYAAPFALLPWCTGPEWRRRFVASFLFFYLLFVGAGGWHQAEDMVDGIKIRRDPKGHRATALALGEWLKQTGIRGGFADYWVAYWLTFHYREAILILPRELHGDRYPPYREQVLAQDRIVDLFTWEDPPGKAEATERKLRESSEFIDKWSQNGFVAIVRKNRR